MKRMVTMIVAALVMSGGARARAQDAVQAHDCRIHHLSIQGTRRADVLTLRAIYVGFDGAPLSQVGCPDQNGPTWGTDRDLASMSPSGFRVTLAGATGEVITVSIATVQHPDRTFYVERRFRF